MSHTLAPAFRLLAVSIVSSALTFPWALPAWAQSSLDRHQRVQRLLQEGKRPEAVRVLLEWQKNNSREFNRNNYDYLLGRLLEQEGRPAEASQVYAGLVERRSILSDHAMWRLALIARSQADVATERQWIRRLIDQHPRSLYVRDGQERLAENLFEGKEWQECVIAYHRLATLSPDLKPEATLKIALAQIQLRRVVEARDGLLKLLSNSPMDDTALAAVQAIDELDRRQGSALSELDHFQRARTYQNNRLFEAARDHFRWIVDRMAVSRYRAQALFELGRGFYLQGRYDEAIEWFERAHDQFPKEREGEQGYYQVGHAHARAGREADAVKRYEAFIGAYPKSEWLGGAHLNAIDALRSAGKASEALEWCERTWKRFPGELPGVTALFSRARMHLASWNYGAALEDLNGLLEQNLNRTGPSAPNRPEILFLKADCLERLGRSDQAIDLYFSLPEQRDNFYGERATARLRALAANGPASKRLKQRFEQFQQQVEESIGQGAYPEAKRAAHQALRIAPNQRSAQALEKKLVSIYQELPAYHRVYTFRAQSWAQPWAGERGGEDVQASSAGLARQLIFLGLYDEGARALAAHYGELNGDGAAAKRRPSLPELFTLAVFLHRGGDAYRTIRIGERSFAGLIPADFRTELLPNDVAQLLYPVAFREELLSEATKGGPDPRFVLAVMRQESRYRPDAKSPAGARGLLQFIPETANRIAEQLHLADFSPEALYRPPVAIRLGITHLHELSEHLRGSLFAVAAGYNSGEENVTRWQARAQVTDEDRFLSEIGFRETKDYVRRVMSNYWAYQKIVDERLKPF